LLRSAFIITVVIPNTGRGSAFPPATGLPQNLGISDLLAQKNSIICATIFYFELKIKI
jgi:hypothetical protein